jgi:hypothetical protein
MDAGLLVSDWLVETPAFSTAIYVSCSQNSTGLSRINEGKSVLMIRGLIYVTNYFVENYTFA